MEGLLPGRWLDCVLGGRRWPWPFPREQTRIGLVAHRRGVVQLSRTDSGQQNRQTRRGQRRRTTKFLRPFSNDHRQGTNWFFLFILTVPDFHNIHVQSAGKSITQRASWSSIGIVHVLRSEATRLRWRFPLVGTVHRLSGSNIKKNKIEYRRRRRRRRTITRMGALLHFVTYTTQSVRHQHFPTQQHQIVARAMELPSATPRAKKEQHIQIQTTIHCIQDHLINQSCFCICDHVWNANKLHTVNNNNKKQTSLKK